MIKIAWVFLLQASMYDNLNLNFLVKQPPSCAKRKSPTFYSKDFVITVVITLRIRKRRWHIIVWTGVWPTGGPKRTPNMDQRRQAHHQDVFGGVLGSLLR